MLGFVVFPENQPVEARLKQVVEGFKTISMDRQFKNCGYTICTYKTQYENNYSLTSDSERNILASGTIMLGVVRGVAALNIVETRLNAGESLDAIYSDLRGPFCLLVSDPKAKSISICTDRDGLMSCFQSADDSLQLISTSLLLTAAMSDCAVDDLGVQEFVHGGACIGGRTLFSGVKRIPSASCISLKAMDIEAPRLLWKAVVHSPYLPDTDKIIVDKMHTLFTAALDTDLQDPSKSFGTDLTAGTDSRTVLSFLMHSGKPITASTAGLSGHVDVERAQQLARIAGIEHYWFKVEDTVDFDQKLLNECIEHSDGAMSPFGLTKQLPYFNEKSFRLDILFGGNGGPLFKDHYWLFELNRVDKKGEPNWARIAKYSLTEGRVNENLFSGGVNYLRHMQTLFLECSLKIAGSNNQKLDFMYFDMKCKYFAGPQFSFANRFMDVYHPMCDGHLVEYSLSIRPWIRKRARLQSELIYRNNKRIAWVPTDNFVPCVPDGGFRSVLRLTRIVRYVRAARRKMKDFVFNKKQLAKDNRAMTFVQSLKSTDLYECYRDPSRLRLAPLLNLQEVKVLCTTAANGAHSGYLQRLYAAEAIVRKVETVSNRNVKVFKS